MTADFCADTYPDDHGHRQACLAGRQSRSDEGFEAVLTFLDAGIARMKETARTINQRDVPTTKQTTQTQPEMRTT